MVCSLRGQTLGIKVHEAHSKGCEARCYDIHVNE